MGLSDLWRLYKAIKSGTYDKVVDLILPPLLENPSVARWLGRNKRVVGFIVTVTGFALKQAALTYPELAYLRTFEPTWVLVAGMVYLAIGFAHAGSKKRRGVDDEELKRRAG